MSLGPKVGHPGPIAGHLGPIWVLDYVFVNFIVLVIHSICLVLQIIDHDRGTCFLSRFIEELK